MPTIVKETSNMQIAAVSEEATLFTLIPKYACSPYFNRIHKGCLNRAANISLTSRAIKCILLEPSSSSIDTIESKNDSKTKVILFMN